MLESFLDVMKRLCEDLGEEQATLNGVEKDVGRRELRLGTPGYIGGNSRIMKNRMRNNAYMRMYK